MYDVEHRRLSEAVAVADGLLSITGSEISEQPSHEANSQKDVIH